MRIMVCSLLHSLKYIACVLYIKDNSKHLLKSEWGLSRWMCSYWRLTPGGGSKVFYSVSFSLPWPMTILCEKRTQGVGVGHHHESTQCNSLSPCPLVATPGSHLHLVRDQRKTLQIFEKLSSSVAARDSRGFIRASPEEHAIPEEAPQGVPCVVRGLRTCCELEIDSCSTRSSTPLNTCLCRDKEPRTWRFFDSKEMGKTNNSISDGSTICNGQRRRNICTRDPSCREKTKSVLPQQRPARISDTACI